MDEIKALVQPKRHRLIVNVSDIHTSFPRSAFSKCPDECREAISSLVYAAARVSEVPELRDLMSLFADRYGNSLEQFVNPEFVERFKAEPPSKEMKVELLQEIAREYSIKWEAKSLEQRLYTPPPPKTKANNPEKNTSSISFHGRKESLDDDNNKSMSRRSEDDSMSTSESCVSGPEEDPETKPLYRPLHWFQMFSQSWFDFFTVTFVML